MITVHGLGRKYQMVITDGEDKITFTFQQLSYFTKHDIAAAVTSIKNGVPFINQALQVFENVRHSLKEVEGLDDPEGNPYQLRFANDGTLEKTCVEELFSCEFSNTLQFAALKLDEVTIPTEIIHPTLGTPIEGIEVIIPKRETQVKNS